MGRDMVAAIDQAQPTTAAELHDFLQSLLDEVHQAGGQCAMACLLAVNQKSILATYQGSILLKRNGKVGVILSAQDHLKVVEGRYTPEDTLVLATAQGSSYLGEIQQKISQGFDLDTTITSLVPAIHAAANSSLISLGFVTLDSWVDEPEPEPEPEPESASFLPELEITLETIEEDSQQPALDEQSLPPVEPVQLASTDKIASESPLASTPPKPVKPPPVSIMWTKSSKTSMLPPMGEILGKVRAKVGPGVSRLTTAAVTKFKTINWHTLHPKAVWDRFSNRDVYVTRQSRRQLIKIIGPVVVVVVVIGAGLIFWRFRQAQQVNAAQAAAAPIVMEFEQARTQIGADPVSARQQMEESIARLERLEQDFAGQGAGRSHIQQVLGRIRAAYQELSGREELSTLPIYFDLSQIAPDWIANQVTAEGERLAVLDQGKQQVAIFDWASRSFQTLPALEVTPRAISMTQENVVVLGEGVWRANLSAESPQFSRVIDEGDSNRDGSLLGSYGSFVYVVNPVRRNIFRYTSGSDGFSDPIGWFRPGQQFNYENLYSISIDGDIWVGRTNGELQRLTMGEVTDFAVRGLPEPFTSSIMVFTKDGFEYVYILEPASRRLVILQKTGEFIRQIQSASLAAATGLVVNEAQGQALVISGSLIFQVDL